MTSYDFLEITLQPPLPGPLRPRSEDEGRHLFAWHCHLR